MDVHADFKELFELLNVREVDYVIVGGYALAFHGAPRYTGDMDVLVCPDRNNAMHLVEALEAFGFGGLGLDVEDFCSGDRVVQLGRPPVRVDLITSLTGVTWSEAFASRVRGSYGDVPVWFIGRTAFLANKLATGRTKDLADIEALGEKG